MSKLGKIQRQILEVAANRPGGAVLPLPEDLSLRAGALKATLTSLIKRGLAEEQGRRKTKALVITEAGRAAVDPGDGEGCARLKPSASPNDGIAGLRPETKQARIAALLTHPEGAGIAELMEATGWQPHSVRAALTGFRRRGIPVTRSQDETGVTLYRIATE